MEGTSSSSVRKSNIRGTKSYANNKTEKERMEKNQEISTPVSHDAAGNYLSVHQ